MPSHTLAWIRKACRARPGSGCPTLGRCARARTITRLVCVCLCSHHHPPCVSYFGQDGGGVADVIFGSYAPSGRLPFSVPVGPEQLGDIADYAMQSGYGRTYRYNRYTNSSARQSPLFPTMSDSSQISGTCSSLPLVFWLLGCGVLTSREARNSYRSRV